MKPKQFVTTTPGAIVMEMCVTVMKELATQFVSGTFAEDQLYKVRDEIAGRMGLECVENAKRPKTKATPATPAQATLAPATPAPATLAPATLAQSAATASTDTLDSDIPDAPTARLTRKTTVAAAKAKTANGKQTIPPIEEPETDAGDAPTEPAPCKPTVTMATLGVRQPQWMDSSSSDMEEPFGVPKCCSGSLIIKYIHINGHVQILA